MIVRRFFEPLLAQTSYLIGCGATGQAIVIDPNRDTDLYVRAAAAEQVAITHVTETHIHADFLSGSRELARRTRAELLLSDEGDTDWKYGFANEGQLLHHGDRVKVGNVIVEAVHTPGHTPEHLTFLITDGAVANEPIAAATGDFIFVGDVGRPDLLERAAKLKGTMKAGAETLYRSLQAFNHHEDWLQIWPGHGAGSACGKGISAVPHSTLGYERRFNWAFKTKGEDEFVANVLAGQPDPPTYFATMKRMNKEGPRLLDGFHAPPRQDDAALRRVIADGGLVLDTRTAAEYAEGFVPGTLNIPLNASFVTWAGWLVPYDQDFFILVDEGVDARLVEVVRALALIGLDRLAGYFSSSALAQAGPLSSIPQVRPEDLATLRDDGAPLILDVRHDPEWAAGHLPGALHIPLGHLSARLSEIPAGRPIVAQCRSGGRSSIAASLLRRSGAREVSNLTGGFEAWDKAGLPIER
ncbi:MAG: MBL fold metallo-hydrolase [Acidobacteriota bacterium]